VILRIATAADAAALESFDLGGPESEWLGEVIEIVGGLLRWQRDEDRLELDRRVIVAEVDGAVAAVAAHERVAHDRLGPLADHRYVMVLAVRADHRRTGIGVHLLESVLSEMQRAAVLTVSWLVHPANLGSAAFSRTCFPDADETYPPDDRPYARFTLRL
jgi:GNAT superfamily N-acetyltransferase